MQYLFNSWTSLQKILSRAKHIFLCLDFDGTLAPIKPTPEQANISADRRLLLRKVSQLKPFTIAIISGRSLKDIKNKVGIEGLIFAGNHGLEIAYQERHFIYPAARKFVPIITEIAQKLARKVRPFSGAILEKKHLSLSLHYRLVQEKKVSQLKAIFLQIVKPYLTKGKIKLTSGKKVWEIRPPLEWDKGKAVLWLAQRLKAPKALPIYIGDDTTDEDAFREVNRIGGISILVGKRQCSCAKYYLKSTKDTQKFLEKIQSLRQ